MRTNSQKPYYRANLELLAYFPHTFFLSPEMLIISSHAKLITCPIELKPLRGNDRHV
ncbi:hypothetical protein [Microcystis aeruginosa]|uniref:Uncharacterized protein n=1 Tax=Microcystis aeruginosa PCC 9808 TaxID=1160284 RepID=I4HV20_MICAE|nr:hypothetical protein [Microcystis aeruginosa]CCI25894.1 hypothetical protein MICAG_2940005 [Microcystis aeruginosa PCC 9808]